MAQESRIHLPVQETWVQSLGREDCLEKEMTTHSSVLVWEILWTEEPGGPQSMGSQRVGHGLVTRPQQWKTKEKLIKKRVSHSLSYLTVTHRFICILYIPCLINASIFSVLQSLIDSSNVCCPSLCGGQAPCFLHEVCWLPGRSWVRSLSFR